MGSKSSIHLRTRATYKLKMKGWKRYSKHIGLASLIFKKQILSNNQSEEIKKVNAYH
jgi:hypothetical protein